LTNLRIIYRATERLSLDEIKKEGDRLAFSSTTKSVPPGQQYKPDLPMPRRLEPQERRISFLKKVEDIKVVADYLFGEPDASPSPLEKSASI